MGSSRPSPALVVALIALFAALGGGAYAAGRIDGRDIAKGSISGSKLRRNTLGGRQISEGRLGTVPRAARARGLTGVYAREKSVVVPGDTEGDGSYQTRGVTVTCRGGDQLLDGGTYWSASGDQAELVTVGSTFLTESEVSPGSRFEGPLDIPTPAAFAARGGNDSGQTQTFTARVFCLRG